MVIQLNLNSRGLQVSQLHIKFAKYLFQSCLCRQIAKLLLDNDIISYIVYLVNIINKTNINLFSIKYKQVI